MQSYNDLEIYQIARKLAVEIHKMTLNLPKFELYEEGSQIRRSSKSVSTNIVEGFGEGATCNVKRLWLSAMTSNPGALKMNLKPATCNVQRAMCNVQPVTCNVVRVTWYVKLILFVIFLTSSAMTSAYAGDIDQTLAPSNDATRMYTLKQIYDKLHSGTNATKQSGGFKGPTAGPGSTMNTLDDIYDDFKADADNCDSIAADVLSGTTFFAATGSTRGTNWGPVAGTMPSLTLSNSTVAVPAGYYGAGTALNVIDTDLAAGNIKKDVGIFGVTGTYEGGGGTAGLPKTGQTTSYATGDDGDLEVGIARSYTYSDDGTIDTEDENILTDNATGLMWIRNHTLVTGSGTGAGGNQNISVVIDWATALTRCNALEYGSKPGGGKYDDWRLPNVYELYSICKLDAALSPGPFIEGKGEDDTAFPGTFSDYYWSSSTSPRSTTSALLVYFDIGSVGNGHKANALYVRAVRGGQ